MAKEVRVIQFEQHEVLSAAQTFMTERSGLRDSSAIVHVTFTQGNDGVMGELHSIRSSGEENNRVMSSEDMLVAMLLFCSRKRIPLPIRSAKRLELHGSSLLLKITVPSR